MLFITFKLVRFFSIFLLVTALTVTTVYQFKVEQYRIQLEEKYNFFSDQKRISWQPFVLFYIDSKVLNNEVNKIYWQCMHKPYRENNLLGKNAKIIFNIEFNAYLTKCFYDKEELNPETDNAKI